MLVWHSPKLVPVLFAKLFPFDHMPRNIASRDRLVTVAAGAYRLSMASSRGYGRRGSNRLADMSLPAETRRKPKRHKAGKRKTAQMDHGSSPAGRRKRRDGERKMNRERRAG